MPIVNISIPHKLKEQADELVAMGFYTSFSDLVRHAMRELLREYEHAEYSKKLHENDEENR